MTFPMCPSMLAATLASAASFPAARQAGSDAAGAEPTVESVVAALATYLAGMPAARFDFEVDERSHAPPPRWRDGARAQFERSIAASIADVDSYPAARETNASEWEAFASGHLEFLEGTALEERATQRRFQYEISADYVEFRAEMQPNEHVREHVRDAWMSVLYTEQERLQVIVVRSQPQLGDAQLDRQAVRTPREVQDVERADNTQWLIHAREFVRTLLESMRTDPQGWICRRERTLTVARWTIDEPAEWPGFYFHQGLVTGTIELRLDSHTGAPNSFDCRDATDERVHEVSFGDYHQDGRFALPLRVEVKTWYIGTGMLRSSAVFRGTVSQTTRRSTYAELVPAGTHVTDARFHPPVSYVERMEPVGDAEVIEMSSRVAGNSGREQRTDLLVESSQPPGIDAAPGLRPVGSPFEFWGLRAYVGGALIVGALAWMAFRFVARRSS